ncbi:MAG: AMP-binding protein, partial [Kiloniellales bacterium]|nr:AMP-binding protein [Kiloniellales bacterium]
MDLVGNRTLSEILEHRAATQPEDPFVIFDDTEREVTRMTYGDFDRSVNRTARLLLSLGIARGDKINLHL